jgi:hypothetical protein
MEMKKMLVSVLTTAVGFSLGLMVYNRFMMGSAMKQTKPIVEDTSTEEEGE